MTFYVERSTLFYESKDKKYFTFKLPIEYQTF